MGKISEIMLLKQPKQSALAVEVQTDLKGIIQGTRRGHYRHPLR